MEYEWLMAYEWHMNETVMENNEGFLLFYSSYYSTIIHCNNGIIMQK